MNRFTVLEYALLAVLAVVLVSLVAGQLLGYPVVLGHVDSGSMEPTLNKGDGFVAVPAPLAGDIERGDVVVFTSQQVHGGKPTTHRVVEERTEGYITKGDNNPFTDQGTDGAPVTDGQVKAVALTVDGSVVRIPHLGTGADIVSGVLDSAEEAVAQGLGVERLGTQQLSYLLFGLGFLTFLMLFVTDRTGGRRERERSRSRLRAGVFDTRLLLAVSLVVLCAGATLGMVVPAGTETFGVVSSEGNATSPTIIPVGESDSVPFRLHNGGYLPTVSHLETESEGISVDPDRVRLARNESRNTTVTLEAPDETGYYVRSMTEHRYLVVVPPGLIDALYRVHPWAPYVLINAVIASPLVLLWLVFGGGNTLRVRRRGRERAGGVLDRL